MIACGYDNPTILQARTNNTDLSYDYVMVKGACSNFEPAIIDTDGALRWVGTAGFSVGSSIFFDNAVYFGHGHQLSRIDLDGTVTQLADYSSLGISLISTIISTVEKLELSWTRIPQHTTTR